MDSDDQKCGVADETRAMRLVRAVTWTSILVLATFFWTVVLWLLFAYALR